METGIMQAAAIQSGTVQAGTVQAGAVQSGAVQAGTVQAGAVQSGAIQSAAVQSGLAAQEVLLHRKTDLPLPKKGSNVYLLSGKKWRNIECQQVKEFKEIYYRFDLVLWDLCRVFDKINAESLAYSFPGIEIPQEIGIDSFTADILARTRITLADNESLLLRYNRWGKGFCFFKFSADNQQEFGLAVANYAQLVSNAKIEAENAAENAEPAPIGQMINKSLFLLNEADWIEAAEDDSCAKYSMTEGKEGKKMKIKHWMSKKKEMPVFDDSTREASPLNRTPNSHPASGHPATCHPAFGDPASGHTSSSHISFGQPATCHPAFGHPAFGHPAFGADSNFTSEQNYLIDRAIDAVERLQLTGLPMELIKKLISVETRFSRIVITDKFRIFLADYNNKEVVMGPLPKVIFLFFLKHDREFMFSDLMDYKEELLEIYEKVSNRGDKEKMRQSIESLVDPTNNSICEKCTAVRKAFLEQITYNVARNYFIDGRQGLPKKIHLNRSLVVWDAKI